MKPPVSDLLNDTASGLQQVSHSATTCRTVHELDDLHRHLNRLGVGLLDRILPALDAADPLTGRAFDLIERLDDVVRELEAVGRRAELLEDALSLAARKWRYYHGDAERDRTPELFSLAFAHDRCARENHVLAAAYAKYGDPHEYHPRLVLVAPRWVRQLLAGTSGMQVCVAGPEPSADLVDAAWQLWHESAPNGPYASFDSACAAARKLLGP